MHLQAGTLPRQVLNYIYTITIITMTTKKELQEQERQEAITQLRKYIDPTEGIVIIVRSVSASGMSRTMDVYTRDLSNYLNFSIAKATGLSMKKSRKIDNEALVIHGVGMDMRFWLADIITHAIYTDSEKENLKGNGKGCLPWTCL